MLSDQSNETSVVSTTQVPVTEAVLTNLRRIARTIDLRSRDLMRRHGLTVPQLVVLREIRRRGAVTGSALARDVSLSQATVTGILQRLEGRQLVAGRRSESDRRRRTLCLTEQGEQLVAAAPEPLQSRFSERLGRLASWEQSMILAALERLVELMEAERLDASPYLATGAVDAAPSPARPATAQELLPAVAEEPTALAALRPEGEGPGR